MYYEAKRVLSVLEDAEDAFQGAFFVIHDFIIGPYEYLTNPSTT